MCFALLAFWLSLIGSARMVLASERGTAASQQTEATLPWHMRLDANIGLGMAARELEDSEDVIVGYGSDMRLLFDQHNAVLVGFGLFTGLFSPGVMVVDAGYSLCLGACRSNPPVGVNLSLDVGPSVALLMQQASRVPAIGGRASLHARLLFGPIALGLQFVARAGGTFSSDWPGNSGAVAMWLLGPTLGVNFGR